MGYNSACVRDMSRIFSCSCSCVALVVVAVLVVVVSSSSSSSSRVVMTQYIIFDYDVSYRIVEKILNFSIY